MAVEFYNADKNIYERMFALIEKNHPDLYIVQDEICILFRSLASKVGGQKQMGKASKVSPKTRAYARTNYLLELELAQDVWENLTYMQQEALLDHLLTSCRCTEDPESGEIRVSIARPDLLLFKENVERYGIWFPSENDRKEGGLRFQVVREKTVEEVLQKLQEQADVKVEVLPAEA